MAALKQTKEDSVLWLISGSGRENQLGTIFPATSINKLLWHLMGPAAEGPLLTLQVVKGVRGRGLLRGRLGDGFEVGAVALQDWGHEPQEGFLDLHLQGHLLLVPREVRVDGGQVQSRVLVWSLANCHWKPRKNQMMQHFYSLWFNSFTWPLYGCYKKNIWIQLKFHCNSVFQQLKQWKM